MNEPSTRNAVHTASSRQRPTGSSTASTARPAVFCCAAVISRRGSGGALALGVCDELAMLENAVYSVISPRGFASIVWKDASREKQAANVLKITAEDLMEFGVCDHMIKEPGGGAHKNPAGAAQGLRLYLRDALARKSQIPLDILLETRYDRFRKIGEFEE